MAREESFSWCFRRKKFFPVKTNKERAEKLLKKIVLLLAGIILLGSGWAQAGEAVKLLINGVQAEGEPSPLLKDNRVFVPVRFVSEQLGAQVTWDGENKTVVIEDQRGDRYLKGENNPSAQGKGIGGNLLSPAELKKILDDDNDNDLADYRPGHNGGDQPGNDPLIVDVRKKTDYDAAHIPGAVWIAPAENMAEKQNVAELKRLLAEHVARGGQNEVVLYCYTGNTSGLVAGVLGAQGLSVKNLMYGFDIGWRGTKQVDRPVYAPMENSGGKTLYCGG